MRTVIDMQGLQAAWRLKRLGNDALAIVRTIERCRARGEVILMLSGQYPETIAPIRAAFAGLLPAGSIRVWHTLDPVCEGLPGTAWRREVGLCMRDLLLARLRPDVVFNPGSLEEFGEIPADSEAMPLGGMPVMAESVKSRRKAVAGRRLRLAYVSPLPPQRSGISGYSAELIPVLGEFYDIDVVLDQPSISTPWIMANCRQMTVDGFLENAQDYDRVLYHVGNSRYHLYMFELMARVPGVAVLHDFHLGDVQLCREVEQRLAHAWTRALYESHGYGAVIERFRAGNSAGVKWKYPVNFEVVQQALGIIIHSRYSRELADKWYAPLVSDNWSVIPLLRQAAPGLDRAATRRKLGLQPDEFVVCSFGILGALKLNHRLLDAWLSSRLAQDDRCRLVFVGENQDVNYGAQLAKGIVASGLSQRITITGWVDESTFLDYLGAADLAVQLRTLSLGETSGAVLDCMNHAVPTIVNANGAMAELPVDAVWMLTSAFEDGELRDALETLWSDKGRRQAMGLRARQVVQERHAPSCCARQYRDAIEQYYGPVHGLEVIRGLVAFDGYDVTDADCMAVAQVLTQTLPVARPARPLYVDVSAIWRDDLKTGIQRGVRALLWSLVQEPPAGYRIEPVYLSDGGGRWHYRYARDWAARIFGVPGGWMEDDAVDFAAGDILLVADLTGAFVVEGDRAGVYGALRNEGVALHFVVYDLLPVLMPEVFPPGEFGFAEWLRVVCRLADGLVCISRSVAGELREWLEGAGVDRLYPARIGWFHLGADMANALPSFGLTPEDAQKVETLKAAPYFIMVGTIEPRKGHLQVLDAFSAMWQAGSDVCLVIVGRAGWPGLPDEMRRTIPEIAKAISSHAELNQHLFWFDGVSDECLERLYAGAKCLIAASKGEGFGLPLIEAAQHGVPVLARDIPVFREVAGDHAFYFKGDEPQELREAIQTWLILEQQGKVPQSSGMPWLTWRESTAQLMANILPVKVP